MKNTTIRALALASVSALAFPAIGVAQSSRATVQSTINTNIRANGTGAITGTILNTTLNLINTSVVYGPGTTVVGHIPIWNDTAGTNLTDGASTAVLKNSTNAVMALNIDSGLSTAQSSRINFLDRGTPAFMMGLQSDGAFTFYDYTSATNAISLRASDGAATFTAPMTIDVGTAAGPALVLQTSNDTAWPGLWLKNNNHGVNGQVQIFLARPYAPYGAADLDIWQIAEDIDSSSGWYRPFAIEAVDGNTGVIATPLQATRSGLVGINGVALPGVALAVRGTTIGGVGPVLSYNINGVATTGRYAFGAQTAYIEGDTVTNSISSYVNNTRIHTVTTTGFFPAANTTFALGGAGLQWTDVFAQRGNFSGALVATTGTFSGAVSGTTGTFSSAVSGTTGTFSGAVSGAGATFSSGLSATTGTFSSGLTATTGIFTVALYGTTVATSSTIVASLPTCSAPTKGMRHFVTDANASFTAGIGAVVAAGGANNVPVTCDGTNWRIG